jgi:hypothetical protein
MVLIILVSPTLNHALIATHWLRARNAGVVTGLIIYFGIALVIMRGVML